MGMDRAGDSGARGDDVHHDGAVDFGDPRGASATDAQRQWTHPSEMGMQARVRVDRRRSRVMVIGLVAVGAGVLLTTAAVAAMISGSEPATPIAAADVPLSDSLALVDVTGANGDSAHVTGLLVDDGRHVLVVGDGFEATDQLAVSIGGARTNGTVAARDPYVDLMLLELETPSGSAPEMSPRPMVGDALRIVRFDPSGHRRSVHVHVDDVAMTWSRPDYTVAEGVMALSGDTADTGVLIDPNGAVAGLVIGTADGRSVAYHSDTLRVLVDRMRRAGIVEHPWIGVRAGDVPAVAEGPVTAVGGPSAYGTRAGAVVVEVVRGSPAQAAGMMVGDLVTAVDDRPVSDMQDLLGAVAPLSPGDTVALEVIRAGAPVRIDVVVGVFTR